MTPYKVPIGSKKRNLKIDHPSDPTSDAIPSHLGSVPGNPGGSLLYNLPLQTPYSIPSGSKKRNWKPLHPTFPIRVAWLIHSLAEEL